MINRVEGGDRIKQIVDIFKVKGAGAVAGALRIFFADDPVVRRVIQDGNRVEIKFEAHGPTVRAVVFDGEKKS